LWFRKTKPPRHRHQAQTNGPSADFPREPESQVMEKNEQAHVASSPAKLQDTRPNWAADRHSTRPAMWQSPAGSCRDPFRQREYIRLRDEQENRATGFRYVDRDM